MPLEGQTLTAWKEKQILVELEQKTLGIVGIGRIGQDDCKIALTWVWKLLPADSYIDKVDVKVEFFDGQSILINNRLSTILYILDFITLRSCSRWLSLEKKN
jgi:D-3-phosphoglycerate dehydrogenase